MAGQLTWAVEERGMGPGGNRSVEIHYVLVMTYSLPRLIDRGEK